MTEESDLKIQNLTKLYSLVMLKSKEAVTGYYILERLKKDLGKTASPTYVYDFLKTLKEEGYIEEIVTEESKRSKGYRLTISGQDFIDRIFSRFDNLIEVAIQSKLEICKSCGVKLYGKFHTEAIHGEYMNFCCKHCAKAYKNTLHDT
ncbi:MAG: helix-turn-helix transcriptional regulator [Promethearchaeota archaeon]|jgi:DNA-binding PadR family transcriptional regulator